MSNFGRRLAGALFGAMLGLIYSFVSLVINRITLPGIPLYVPPPGLTGNILYTMLLAVLIGLVTCWPESGLLGTFLGGLVGAVLVIIGTFSNALGTQRAFGVNFTSLFYSLLPLIYVTLPIIVISMLLSAPIRWSVQSLVPADPTEPINLKKTIWPTIIILALTILLGSLSIYSSLTRTELRQMDSLVQEGIQTTTTAALPEPLQPVDGFLEKASGAYSLEWADNADAFQGPRPTISDSGQTTITVRFDNGFTFVCLFIPKASHPLCEAQ